MSILLLLLLLLLSVYVVNDSEWNESKERDEACHASGKLGKDTHSERQRDHAGSKQADGSLLRSEWKAMDEWRVLADGEQHRVTLYVCIATCVLNCSLTSLSLCIHSKSPLKFLPRSSSESGHLYRRRCHCGSSGGSTTRIDDKIATAEEAR